MANQETRSIEVRPIRTLLIGILSLVAITVIALVSAQISSGIIVNGKIFGMAVVPEIAVRDSMQVDANKLQNFRILQEQQFGLRRLLIFSYTIQPIGQPPRDEFGYSLTELRAGWSAIPGKLAANALPPARVTYASDQLDGQTIVYGKILDPNVTTIEAVFDNGAKKTIHPHNEALLITVFGTTQLQELRALDTTGQLLQHTTTTELKRHW